MQPDTCYPLTTDSLVDTFGRRIDYLRVSVTDRCDLRCTYCMPKGFNGFEEPANWLSHAEMHRLVSLFVRLGVGKIRLTGGEPLLRHGIAELAGAIAATPGVRDLSLSSNGTQLARHARALYTAGVQRLNISLDSLDADCMARVTGRDCLADVLAGLRAAKAAGFAPIKLNMVVQRGVNDHELHRMVQFAVAEGYVLRLIEPMPMGETGREAVGIDLNRLGQQLAHTYGLIPEVKGQGAGPARYWRTSDSSMCLGIITPMSQHFCASCNRVRLTVDGTLYLCLGQEFQVPLGAMLRDGADDIALLDAIRAGIAAKPERHEFTEQPAKIVRFMSQTGG